MKKLIITTDDYGVIPSINSAIIEAINKNKVNSVAAFSNYDGSRKYKSAVANAKILLDKTNGNVDLGCHVTITSGKPITEDKAKDQGSEKRPPGPEGDVAKEVKKVSTIGEFG